MLAGNPSLRNYLQDIKMLAELRARHDKVLKEALELQREMEDFRLEVHEEVEAVLERTKFEIRGPRTKVPVAVDEGSPPPRELPPPLAPSPSPSPVADKGVKTATLVDLGGEAGATAGAMQQPVAATAGGGHEGTESSYKGFSAQSFAIPNISCNNALEKEE